MGPVHAGGEGPPRSPEAPAPTTPVGGDAVALNGSEPAKVSTAETPSVMSDGLVETTPGAGDRTAAPRRQPALRRRLTRRNRLRRDWMLVAMVAPAMAVLLVFTYVPLLGNIIAFQDYSPFVGIWHSPFVGFANFQRLFENADFWSAVKNTLVLTSAQLVFFFPVPIALALLLNSVLSSKLRATVQAIVYLPYFFSWVLVVTLFQQIFGGAGVISQFLRAHNWGSMDLMTNPHAFVGLVTAQAVWKDAGWNAIIFLAALDGAGRWRRLWHITLPGLRPVIVLVLILRLGNALTVGFEQILLQRDAVGAKTSEVLDTFVYYTGVVNGDWAYGAAAGLFKGIVGLVLVLAANRVAHALGEQGVYSRE